jgi:hypothetical protein
MKSLSADDLLKSAWFQSRFWWAQNKCGQDLSDPMNSHRGEPWTGEFKIMQYAQAELISTQQPNRRGKLRSSAQRTYSISWQDEAGLTHSAQVQGTDVSLLGIGIRCPIHLRKGTAVYIEAEDGYLTGYGVVCHATRRGTGYTIGLELNEASMPTKRSTPMSSYRSTRKRRQRRSTVFTGF